MARRMTSPELVGRAGAVEQVRSALASARGGHPRHLLVSGEAGVGKTRLLSRTGELAAQDGARVLLGGCVSMGDAGLPFAPYAEILRSLIAHDGVAGATALAGRGAKELARLAPALGSDEALPVQERWADSRVLEAILELFRRMAAREPLMVQLEDLHWADAGTLAATSFLFRSIREEPIVIVATIRSDEVTRRHPVRPWMAEVTRTDRVDRLDLEPLTSAESAELVRNITGSEPPPEALAEIHERSDGNPFFVEELLASGLDSDAVLPSSLRDVLLTRVDAMSPSAQDLLGVAAIGGREVDHDVLVAVSGRSDPALRDDLRSLVDGGLLVALSTPDRDGYSFRHALLQEAVEDALLPPERRRLHRAYGAYLEGRGDAASGEANLLLRLAHHWREARDDRALAASIRAGDAATASYFFATAVEEYDHALTLWDDAAPTTADQVDIVDLLARAGPAAINAGDYRRAVAIARRAIEASAEDPDGARRAELGFVLGRALWVSGDWRGSLAAYEEAAKVAPPPPHLARIRALAGLGQANMLFGWLSRARPLCEEAIAMARSVGARDLEGHGLNTLSITLAGMGESEAALDAIDRALAIAMELDIPDDIGRAHVNRGDVLNQSGYPDRALASTLVGIQTAIDLGMGSSYGTYLRLNGVQYAYAVGDWAQARELLDAADRSAAIGPGAESYRAECALPFLVNSGAPDATETRDRSRRMRSEHPPSATTQPIYMASVEAACFDGRFEQAADLGQEGLTLLLEIDAYDRIAEMARVAARPIADLGRRATAAGDRAGVEAARERMGPVTAALAARGDWYPDIAPRVRDFTEANEAQVAAEGARLAGEDTSTGWRAVADRWLALGLPYQRAYALWRAAEAADASDDREAAVAALRDSHEIASRLGAIPLLGGLDVVARKLRVRLGSGSAAADPGGPAFGLTPREREVLGLVAAGRTNKQIATELFISDSTAGVHVGNILAKLGVATRTEAANVALSQGLVES